MGMSMSLRVYSSELAASVLWFLCTVKSIHQTDLSKIGATACFLNAQKCSSTFTEPFRPRQGVLLM